MYQRHGSQPPPYYQACAYGNRPQNLARKIQSPKQQSVPRTQTLSPKTPKHNGSQPSIYIQWDEPTPQCNICPRYLQHGTTTSKLGTTIPNEHEPTSELQLPSRYPTPKTKSSIVSMRINHKRWEQVKTLTPLLRNSQNSSTNIKPLHTRYRKYKQLHPLVAFGTSTKWLSYHKTPQKNHSD